MSGALRHKLRRDIWRERWRFTAIVVVMVIGVAVFIAAAEAHRSLEHSFDHAYAAQRLPDAILSGPGAVELRDAVSAIPGRPLVEVRHQADVGIRVGGHALYGRAVGVPAAEQPSVSRLDLQAGALPGDGQLVVEQHLADHYRLGPGDTVELFGRAGWQPFPITGSALSPEYLWPARSAQEVFTTPEDFGVVFLPDHQLRQTLPDPVEQVAVYAQQRSEVGDLVAASADLARRAGLQFVPRAQQVSYRTLTDNVEQFGAFAALLPLLFLAAIMLATYVLLSRLVSAQRAVIGTLRAGGLSAGAVRRHYLGYGLVCAVAGIPPGLLGGWLLARWITAEFAAAIGLPQGVVAMHPPTYLLAGAVTVAVALLSAVAPAAAAARIRPAAAMRVAPPSGRGRRSGVERLAPQLARAPARWRMVLRALGRNRRRSAFTVIGVAASVVLVMVFAGMRDTVPGMVDRQFGQIERQDGKVVMSGPADAVLDLLRADRDIAAVEPYGSYRVVIAAGRHRYDTALIALDPQTRMHAFTAVAGTGRLAGAGVLLGVGLRDLLSVSVGERIEVVLPAQQRRFTERVAGFVDEPFSPVVYTSIAGLVEKTGLPGANGALLKLRDGADRVAAGDRIAGMPGVVAYRSTTALAATMRETFRLYDTLVGIMLAFAAVMAAAMLYNAMSANVSERIAEFGALHAEGMSTGMLARLIAAENLGLAGAAIPFGVVGGAMLADRLLYTYHSLGYHLRLEMRPATPVLVIGCMVAAAALAQLPAARRVRGIDLARIVRERAL